MLRYHIAGKGHLIIGVLADGLPPETAALAEKLIAEILDLTGNYPAAGDLLEPVHGVQLSIGSRKYEKQGVALCIWFYVQVVA